jgi:integrase
MTIKQVKNGYVMDFTIEHKRHRETIPAPHSKTIEKNLVKQEEFYKYAITTSDKTMLKRYPNSKILKKAFICETDNFTVDKYSSIWFGRYQDNWARSTIRGYSEKYNSHIKPNFGHLTLREFTPSTYHDWAKNPKLPGKTKRLAGKTINDIRSILNQIFEEAFLDNVIAENPIKRTRRSKSVRKEPEPFTKDEVTKILSGLESPYREFYQFFLWTGLRTGELLGLRWEDVDIDSGVAHIRTNITNGQEKAPKTKGSIRSIELHPKALEALMIILNSKYYDSYRVFIDPKTLTTYKYADGLRKYVWKPTLLKVGVRYRYPYQCRHTFASTMLSQGKNPMWVASQMGHVGLKMINDVYGRWLPSQAQHNDNDISLINMKS